MTSWSNSSYRDWSIKDACMHWRDGVWHVFFSAFDQERSFVAHVTTADFITFSEWLHTWDGRDYGYVGFCSPDITFADGRYVIHESWAKSRYNQPDVCARIARLATVVTTTATSARSGRGLSMER